jgi:hypothetical protein
VVESILIALDGPLQRIAGKGGRHGQAIADARFHFRALFIIIPGHKLHGWQLLSGIVESIDLRESLQPRLAALLAHNPVRAPARQAIVKPLVRRSQRLLGCKWHAGIVKTGQVTHPVISGRGHYPGVAAIAQ